MLRRADVPKLEGLKTVEKILLIDDEKGVREVWKRFHNLTELVFRGRLEMDVSDTLAHGIERMKTTKYDVVILDLTIPPIGPDQMIELIHLHHHEMPPIVVITGNSDPFTRRRCIMAGACSFWIKTDAIQRPDLFFKDVYNCYLSTYGKSP